MCRIFTIFLIFFPSLIYSAVYPLYIPQEQNSSYANPRYLIQDGLDIRVTDYTDSSETLPSLPYPQTIEQEGCSFLQNTFFNLFTSQNCFNSCGEMCTSSCSGGCGESCGGPVKWLVAQMAEGMYLSGTGDAANVLDCHFPYEYRIKVRGCTDGWYQESNCGNPADCTGISFMNTGLMLNNSNPGGFPGGNDLALYTTIDLYNFEIDINAYGRIYGNWQGCGCRWYRPDCCAAEAVCEAISISDTLMNRQVTSDPVDEKAILKAYSQDLGNGQTKVGFQIPWSQTTLNNFNVNIFNWSCDIWGWNPCQDLANWLNGLISDWIRGTVESAVDDAVRNELGQGFEYILDIPPDGTNPFDIVSAPQVQGGLDFVSDQLRQGLEGDLKDTLVQSFEGYEFAQTDFYITDLGGCGIYADFDVIVRGCYDSAGNIKPLDSPPAGCYWPSDGRTQLHPGGDPGDNDGLSYQRTGVSLTSDPSGFTPAQNALYTTLQIYDLELDVDAYFTVKFQPGNPYCNWIGNYAFPQRTGLVNATAKGTAELIFDGTSIAMNFSNFGITLNDTYIAAVNWSCCAPSQANCQWDVCRDISTAANLFISNYAVTLLGDILNGEIESLLNSFFDKDGDGIPDPLFDLNDLLQEIPIGDIGLRMGIALNLETSPQPPFGATLRANTGIFPTSYNPCVPLAEKQGIPDTPSPPPVFGDYVPKIVNPYMLGIEISDEFINQALYTLYSAGFLCISLDPESKELLKIGGKSLSDILASFGVTGGTDIISPEISSIISTFLNTDAFALLVPEIWELAPHSPVRIILRPMQPPEVKLGTSNGMIEIKMQDMNIDFYTELDDRPIRAFSIKTDAGMGFTINSINLMSTDPYAKLIDITAGNPQITSTLTFNEAIPVNKGDLEAVVVNTFRIAAPALSGLLSGLKPLLTPPGVNPDKPEGDLFGLTIPQTFVVTDVRSSDDSYDNYLGLFFNLGGTLCWSCLLEGFSFSLPFSTPTLLTQQIKPEVNILAASDGRSIKSLSALSNELIFTHPSGTISLSKGSDKLISYRVDGGLWSNYSKEANIYLLNLLEGRHLIELKERDMSGVVSGTKLFTLRVDSLPPEISVERSSFNRHLNVKVADIQTPEDEILIQWKWDDGEWTGYTTDRSVNLDGLSEGEHILEIKAKDDAGNESSFRTNINITPSEGCGCNAGGNGDSNLPSTILIIISMLLYWRIKKFKAIF